MRSILVLRVMVFMISASSSRTLEDSVARFMHGVFRLSRKECRAWNQVIYHH
jgi:hypothetical protein